MSAGHRHHGTGQHGVEHGPADHGHDQRWLAAALGVISCFMVAEVTVGILAHSLALISDAGHMLTDAASLVLAVIAARLVRRPAAGAYTYGFTRVDALSAQANGITLVLLAGWLAFSAVRRLVHPATVAGGPVLSVALIGVAVNLLAVWLAGRADRSGLNVRGALAHLVSDLWAFLATAIAGLLILVTGWHGHTGWYRADPIAALVVAGLMVHTGVGLIRDAGRVFLEAAPVGTDPSDLGRAMAAVPGVQEVHDLHVWDLGAGAAALSAHLVVEESFDCHEVAQGVRAVLAGHHQIGHATLQADHRHTGRPLIADDCARHGPGYLSEDVH
ncbi:MAG TPA: cation diffusion facilitator family transporter [Jatrophihabitans sp.]|nr:cation diffusion facilitator family transporter [Jatrophihabitans sp.]